MTDWALDKPHGLLPVELSLRQRIRHAAGRRLRRPVSVIDGLLLQVTQRMVRSRCGTTNGAPGRAAIRCDG